MERQRGECSCQEAADEADLKEKKKLGADASSKKKASKAKAKPKPSEPPRDPDDEDLSCEAPVEARAEGAHACS